MKNLILIVGLSLQAQTAVQLSSGQSMQLKAPAVTWSISPAIGSVSQSGLYSAPAANPVQQEVIVSATAGGQTLLSQSITLLADTITLPIEVVGPDGTAATVNFGVASTAVLTGPLTLSLQVHNLRYGSMMSVRVNQGSWAPVNTPTATLDPMATVFGGIGGGFSTIKLAMPMPGMLSAGANQISFRFNGTDGRSSGFRVLGFNVSNSAGNLIPASVFVWDDPAKWNSPLSSASDIAAGKAAFQSENTLHTQMSGPSSAIKAACSDCHAQDGRDLKYFNYSNQSIIARSVFHGLTAQQGNQIASYIRSLTTPAPGRPWNPPYQPGLGLDSQPVADWSAGAGLTAVIANDSAMQAYLMPNGSTAGWAANQYLNTRELPIPLQLPDWNSWLPQVHPMDAFPTFGSSTCGSDYSLVRGKLANLTPAAYHNALQYFAGWGLDCDARFYLTVKPGAWTTTLGSNLYSLSLWEMVKLWEINQEFSLEGMDSTAFGSKANPRGWYTTHAFNTSPNIMQIPSGFIANGTDAARMYLSNAWYNIQLILNDGQGQNTNRPIDFGYAEASVGSLSLSTAKTPFAFLELMWLIKGLQESTLNGGGPNPKGGAFGFTPTTTTPINLVDLGFETNWSATPGNVRAQLSTSYLKAWFSEISSFTAAQYYQGEDGNGRPWASTTEDPKAGNYASQFGPQIWFMLPRFRFIGVDAALIGQISAWAATVWPAGNWALNNSATCKNLGSCTSDR